MQKLTLEQYLCAYIAGFNERAYSQLVTKVTDDLIVSRMLVLCNENYLQLKSISTYLHM